MRIPHPVIHFDTPSPSPSPTHRTKQNSTLISSLGKKVKDPSKITILKNTLDELGTRTDIKFGKV